MGNAIQFNPGGSLKSDGGSGAGSSLSFTDPDTGLPIDLSTILPGVAGTSNADVAPRAVPQKSVKIQTKTETFDVIKAAKQRLRYLNKEIKALKKLEKEKAQLEKLLAAAEKPLALVQDMKRPAK